MFYDMHELLRQGNTTLRFKNVLEKSVSEIIPLKQVKSPMQMRVWRIIFFIGTPSYEKTSSCECVAS